MSWDSSQNPSQRVASLSNRTALGPTSPPPWGGGVFFLKFPPYICRGEENPEPAGCTSYRRGPGSCIGPSLSRSPSERLATETSAGPSSGDGFLKTYSRDRLPPCGGFRCPGEGGAIRVVGFLVVAHVGLETHPARPLCQTTEYPVAPLSSRCPSVNIVRPGLGLSASPWLPPLPLETYRRRESPVLLIESCAPSDPT